MSLSQRLQEIFYRVMLIPGGQHRKIIGVCRNCSVQVMSHSVWEIMNNGLCLLHYYDLDRKEGYTSAHFEQYQMAPW